MIFRVVFLCVFFGGLGPKLGVVMNFDMDFYLKVVLAVLALSGWIKIFYDHQATKPKVTGRVMNVLRGGHESGAFSSRATFAMYVYLLNSRKNSVHVLDYGVRVKIDGKWIGLDRVYGIEKCREASFSDNSGKKIVVTDFGSNFVYMKNEAVQYGVPMHGWIMFSGPGSFLDKKVDEYELTCVDAYGVRHKITTKYEDMVHLALLSQIAGIQIPDGYSSGTAK